MSFANWFTCNSSKQPLSDKIANIHSSPLLSNLAEKYGLEINSVTWEDTARYKDSSCGANISDMTLTTDDKDMPVIRRPNFEDETTDIVIENYNVSVGNERGKNLKRISLKE